jgi:sugar phosphate isomerase/epimerase
MRLNRYHRNSMLLGTMARTYRRDSLEAIADAACADGMQAMQLNLINAGLETLPADLDERAARRIGDVFRTRGLELAALIGAFNVIHPSRAYRAECIRRFGRLAARCGELGTRILSLCTGTRDPDDMWRFHPGNRAPEAWTEMVDTIRRLLDVTEGSGVVLAFEPEVVNVVDTAAKAQALLRELASLRLKVVIDCANLITHETIRATTPVIEDAFDRLGGEIVLAHAKDIAPATAGADHPQRVAPGTGMLDWSCYLRRLAQSGFPGALIMHDLPESEVRACADRLRALAPPGAFSPAA